MSKSHLAEKNTIKARHKNAIDSPAKNPIIEAELVLDDELTPPILKNTVAKTKKKNTDNLILDSANISTKRRKKKTSEPSITKKDDNEGASYDMKTAENEDNEENEDSFDLESSDDLLSSTDLEEVEYDEMEMDNFDTLDGKVYALTSHNHSKDLPVPTQRNLPSPLLHDNLQLFIREISKFPLLQPDEEVELARRVRDEGDSDAAFRIISSHLRLVVKISMDFQRRWMQNVLDLIQEGNVGLMRAVNKFDPDKGIKFSYYATFWIKAYILKFIMDNWRMVKIGTTQAQRKLFYNLNKERQKLLAQGFDPDASALSEALGVSVEQVVEMQQRLDMSDMSLDLPVNDENGSASRIDFLPALGPGIEDAYADSEIASIVNNSISTLIPKLSDKETFILENRLLTDDPVTLREIGERYSVTRERIRQLEARLLVKLRNHLGEDIEDFSESWIQP